MISISYSWETDEIEADMLNSTAWSLPDLDEIKSICKRALLNNVVSPSKYLHTYCHTCVIRIQGREQSM